MLEKLGKFINPLTEIYPNNPLVLGFRDAAKKLIKGSAAEGARPQAARLPLNLPETNPASIDDRVETWLEEKELVKTAFHLRGVTPRGRKFNNLIIRATFSGPEVLKPHSKKDQKAIIELYKDKQFDDLSPDNQETVIQKITGPKPTLPFTLKDPKIRRGKK